MAERMRYVIKDREQSPFAEAFRALSASIRDAEILGKQPLVLFASASAGDGGTMTAVNTAALLAYAGHRVILVDCDLRRPIVGDVFGLKNIGLTNIIQEEAAPETVLQDTWIPGLKVVTSGPLSRGPVAVLSNPQIRTLLEHLRTRADYVFLTSTPILIKPDSIVSDACVLASKVDGVVLVVDSRTVKPKNAQKVLQLLLGAKANIVGTVLNDVIDY